MPAEAGPAPPWVLAASAIGLAVTVVRTQGRIWQLDMANEESAATPPETDSDQGWSSASSSEA